MDWGMNIPPLYQVQQTSSTYLTLFEAFCHSFSAFLQRITDLHMDRRTYGQTDRWIFPFFIRYREPPVHVRLCLSPVVPLSAFLLKITNLPTDRRTYGWTDRPSHRDARLHLKRWSKRVTRKNTANWMMKNNLLHNFFSYCVHLPQKSGW